VFFIFVSSLNYLGVIARSEATEAIQSLLGAMDCFARNDGDVVLAERPGMTELIGAPE
jgi:hypothetical protein